MRQRPSDLVGIKSSVKAFYFDRGVWRFGQRVESEINAAEQNARKTRGKKSKVNEQMVNLARQQALDKALKIDPRLTAKRYKDPALNFKGPTGGKSGGQRVTMSDGNTNVELGAEFLGRL